VPREVPNLSPDPRARPDAEPAPGFFEQVGRTRAAFGRLAGAHTALLRAELADIFAELKVLSIQAGIALGLALLMVNMLFVGGFLFLGEWLFGSLGWGLAHGALLAMALIVVVAMAMLGTGRGPVLGGLLLAAVATVGLALLLASNIAHNTAAYAAQQLSAPLDTAEAVSAIAGALVLGLLLAIVMARLGGAGGAVAGLVVGAVLGAILGYLVGSAWTLAPAVAFAITIGLVLWPILVVVLAWPNLDPAERFARLKPTQTIETTKETKAWLEKEWQRRRTKLGRK
jgi:hypothetical protein